MADSSRLQHLRAGGRGETLTAPRDSSQQQSHQDQATGGQGKQSACSPKTQSCYHRSMFPDAQKLLRKGKQGMETVWEPEPSPRSGRVNL